MTTSKTRPPDDDAPSSPSQTEPTEREADKDRLRRHATAPISMRSVLARHHLFHTDASGVAKIPTEALFPLQEETRHWTSLRWVEKSQPLCGDHLALYGCLEGVEGQSTQSFRGWFGGSFCSLCQVSGSVMMGCFAALNWKIRPAVELVQWVLSEIIRFKAPMAGDHQWNPGNPVDPSIPPPFHLPPLQESDLAILASLTRYETRRGCLRLPWEAAQKLLGELAESPEAVASAVFPPLPPKLWFSAPSAEPLPPGPFKTRIAPSPTGHLHMGHGAHLCYVIGVARVCQHAEIVYRLEDHDQGRCRPLFAASIRNDLRWFLPPDQQTALAHMEVQSHKQARYQEVLSELTGRGLVYACQCSRKTLASTAPPSVGYAATETPYPGTCRDLGIPLETPGCSLRLRLPYTPVFFHDLRHGPLVQFPANQCGDFVLRDRAGHYTYQFTVTIDDLDQGINLIIRGDDLLPSVGRQLLLRRLLGDQTPVWTYHHPLIFDPCTGQKLAKRLQSESWESYRRCGMNADELRGECLFRLGLIPRAVPVTWNDLNRIFFSASMAV